MATYWAKLGHKKRIKSPIDNNKPTTSNNFFLLKQTTNERVVIPTFPGLSKPLFKTINKLKSRIGHRGRL